MYLYGCSSYVSLWIYFSGCISSALHYISIVVSSLYLYGCISPVSSLYFYGSDSFVSLLTLLSYLLCISSLSQLLYLLCIFPISPLISITVSPLYILYISITVSHLNLLYISMVVSPLYLYGCIFSKSLWREDRYFTSIESTLYGFKVISISHSSMHRVYCTGQTIMYNLDLQNRRTPPLDSLHFSNSNRLCIPRTIYSFILLFRLLLSFF